MIVHLCHQCLELKKKKLISLFFFLVGEKNKTFSTATYEIKKTKKKKIVKALENFAGTKYHIRTHSTNQSEMIRVKATSAWRGVVQISKQKKNHYFNQISILLKREFYL